MNQARCVLAKKKKSQNKKPAAVLNHHVTWYIQEILKEKLDFRRRMIRACAKVYCLHVFCPSSTPERQINSLPQSTRK